MKYNKFFINKTKEIISNKFNLIEITPLRLDNLDFLTLLCKNSQSEKFVLKILLNDFKYIKNNFKKEIILNNFLAKNNQIFIPQFISGDYTKEPYWLLYKYADGKTIGNWYRINKNLLTPDLLNSVFLNILTIQKESHNIKKHFNKTDYLNYDFTISERGIEKIKKIISPKILEERLLFFKKNISKIPLTLCHNDLHPQNIILNKKNIFFIDFNQAHLNSPFFDFMLFILCGYKSDIWIKNAIQKLIEIFPDLKNKQSPLRLAFNIALIEVSLRMILYLDSPEIIKNSSKRNQEEIEYTTNAKQYFVNIFTNLDNIFL